MGSYSLRASRLVTRTNGATTRDFAFHLETGLTKNIGLHISGGDKPATLVGFTSKVENALIAFNQALQLDFMLGMAAR
ncbi:MAG: hypothetical protein ACYC9J_02215 [Sulfuricaulis sp.]